MKAIGLIYQLIIAIVLASVIAIPVYNFKKKQYKKQGKSIKNLLYKIYILVLIPIVSVPILLSDLSSYEKLFSILLFVFIGILDINDSLSWRKSVTKVLGLPEEDEDTGEVIKEDKKKN